MKRAWEIAREGFNKFGGKVKEYFAEALKMAWAEAKQPALPVTDVKVEMDYNDWKNYGKHRLYFCVKMRLIEFKNIRGNKVESLRRMTAKAFYDFDKEKMVYVEFVGRDLSASAEGIEQFMVKEIKNKMDGVVERYINCAA